MDNEGIKYSINSKYYPNPSTSYFQKSRPMKWLQIKRNVYLKNKKLE
jgi:hypothetical protein